MIARFFFNIDHLPWISLAEYSIGKKRNASFEADKKLTWCRQKLDMGCGQKPDMGIMSC